MSIGTQFNADEEGATDHANLQCIPELLSPEGAQPPITPEAEAEARWEEEGGACLPNDPACEGRRLIQRGGGVLGSEGAPTGTANAATSAVAGGENPNPPADIAAGSSDACLDSNDIEALGSDQEQDLPGIDQLRINPQTPEEVAYSPPMPGAPLPPLEDVTGPTAQPESSTQQDQQIQQRQEQVPQQQQAAIGPTGVTSRPGQAKQAGTGNARSQYAKLQPRKNGSSETMRCDGPGDGVAFIQRPLSAGIRDDTSMLSTPSSETLFAPRPSIADSEVNHCSDADGGTVKPWPTVRVTHSLSQNQAGIDRAGSCPTDSSLDAEFAGSFAPKSLSQVTNVGSSDNRYAVDLNSLTDFQQTPQADQSAAAKSPQAHTEPSSVPESSEGANGQQNEFTSSSDDYPPRLTTPQAGPAPLPRNEASLYQKAGSEGGSYEEANPSGMKLDTTAMQPPHSTSSASQPAASTAVGGTKPGQVKRPPILGGLASGGAAMQPQPAPSPRTKPEIGARARALKNIGSVLAANKVPHEISPSSVPSGELPLQSPRGAVSLTPRAAAWLKAQSAFEFGQPLPSTSQNGAQQGEISEQAGVQPGMSQEGEVLKEVQPIPEEAPEEEASGQAGNERLEKKQRAQPATPTKGESANLDDVSGEPLLGRLTPVAEEPEDQAPASAASFKTKALSFLEGLRNVFTGGAAGGEEASEESQVLDELADREEHEKRAKEKLAERGVQQDKQSKQELSEDEHTKHRTKHKVQKEQPEYEQLGKETEREGVDRGEGHEEPKLSKEREPSVTTKSLNDKISSWIDSIRKNIMGEDDSHENLDGVDELGIVQEAGDRLSGKGGVVSAGDGQLQERKEARLNNDQHEPSGSPKARAGEDEQLSSHPNDNPAENRTHAPDAQETKLQPALETSKELEGSSEPSVDMPHQQASVDAAKPSPSSQSLMQRASNWLSELRNEIYPAEGPEDVESGEAPADGVQTHDGEANGAQASLPMNRERNEGSIAEAEEAYHQAKPAELGAEPAPKMSLDEIQGENSGQVASEEAKKESKIAHGSTAQAKLTELEPKNESGSEAGRIEGPQDTEGAEVEQSIDRAPKESHREVAEGEEAYRTGVYKDPNPNLSSEQPKDDYMRDWDQREVSEHAAAVRPNMKSSSPAWLAKLFSVLGTVKKTITPGVEANDAVSQVERSEDDNPSHPANKSAPSDSQVMGSSPESQGGQADEPAPGIRNNVASTLRSVVNVIESVTNAMRDYYDREIYNDIDQPLAIELHAKGVIPKIHADDGAIENAATARPAPSKSVQVGDLGNAEASLGSSDASFGEAAAPSEPKAVMKQASAPDDRAAQQTHVPSILEKVSQVGEIVGNALLKQLGSDEAEPNDHEAAKYKVLPNQSAAAAAAPTSPQKSPDVLGMKHMYSSLYDGETTVSNKVQEREDMSDTSADRANESEASETFGMKKVYDQIYQSGPPIDAGEAGDAQSSPVTHQSLGKTGETISPKEAISQGHDQLDLQAKPSESMSDE